MRHSFLLPLLHFDTICDDREQVDDCEQNAEDQPRGAVPKEGKREESGQQVQQRTPGIAPRGLPYHLWVKGRGEQASAFGGIPPERVVAHAAQEQHAVIDQDADPLRRLFDIETEQSGCFSRCCPTTRRASGAGRLMLLSSSCRLQTSMRANSKRFLPECGEAGGHHFSVSCIRPMRLLSASFTPAISLPPPTCVTSCCVCAPASRSACRLF